MKKIVIAGALLLATVPAGVALADPAPARSRRQRARPRS